MMMDSVETPFPSSSSSNHTSTCVHCCVPFRQSSVQNDHHKNIQQSFSQLLSSSSFNSINNGTKSLYSIFKLNYLKAFETLDWELEEEENDMNQLTLLCVNCNDQLTHLYQLYEAFLQLGKIESSLSKKLNRLDEIIDCHAQKNINCDLIPMNRPNNNNSVCTSSTQTPSSSSQPPSKKPPLLVLSRLPESSLKIKTTTTTRNDDDDDVSSSPSHYDDDDRDDDYSPLSPVIKMEVIVDDHDEVDALPDIKLKSSEDVMEPEEDEIPLTSRKKRSTNRSQKNRINSGRPKVTGPTRARGRPKGKTKKNKSKQKSSKGHSSSQYSIPGCKSNYNYVSIKTKFPNPCWYCDRTDFASPADCLEHTKTEHVPTVKKGHGRFPIKVCERCSKICLGVFKTHLDKCLLRPSGAIMEKEFQCTVCPQKCIRMKDLKDHMATHNNDRPFRCDLCDFTAKTQTVLYNHKRNMHQQLGQERVTCEDCGKSYKNEEVLKAHKSNMHTIEGNKRYRERSEIILARRKQARVRILPTFCEDCQVDLFSRLSFCNHRRTVHGDLMCEFTCETCGQPFTTRKALLEHSRKVHSDARPFTCDTCGKSFKRGYTLKDHFLHTHTEEGRLKYNEKTRERNRRKKILQSQLANAGMGQGGGDGDSSNSSH